MKNARRAEAGMRHDRLRLSFAYRSRAWTLALPRGAGIALLGVLPFVALLYLAATCYFVFHDDLLTSLTRHTVEMQYAYEDRISALRHELETVTEQARADQTDFTDRVHALAQRQDQVESRTALVSALADRLTQMRLPASGASEPAPAASDTAAAPVAAPAPAADGKPHPEGFDLRLRPDASASPPKGLMSPIDFDMSLPLPAQIQVLTDRYNRADRADLSILAELQQPAMNLSAHIRAALATAGLSADRLTAAAGGRGPSTGATGGPFVPLPILSDGTAFAAEAAGLETALGTVEKFRRILPHVPLELPLPGQPEVTSGFGPRIDPFLGRPALHTGVDLLEAYGAPVRATAAGVVLSAGMAGGYGNMVEVDHGNGLTTRYAHLSSIDVTPGQTVSFGTILGRIGETGRATGPHLHYEVRIDGEPVDPERFFRAGAELVADSALPPP